MAVRVLGSTRDVMQFLITKAAANSRPVILFRSQGLVAPSGQVLLRRDLLTDGGVDGDFHGGSSPLRVCGFGLCTGAGTHNGAQECYPENSPHPCISD